MFDGELLMVNAIFGGGCILSCDIECCNYTLQVSSSFGWAAWLGLLIGRLVTRRRWLVAWMFAWLDRQSRGRVGCLAGWLAG